MTSFTLVRHAPSRQRLNLHGLVPDLLLTSSIAEIHDWPIRTEAGTTIPLANQFTLLDGARDRLVLQGDLSDCDFVAGGMRSGELVVESSVGNFLACAMRGGTVIVSGNAANYTCSSLRGGHVTVRGDVGRYAAAAAPQASRGMAGGELLIGGSAEQFLGSRMRRGRVIVLGDLAAGCASRLIAGTIVACGRVQLPLAYAMARGTILLLNPTPQLMAGGVAGFTQLQSSELSFLPLLLKDIAHWLPDALAEELVDSRWLRGLGDRAIGGQGEIFVRHLSSPSPAESWTAGALPV